MARCLENLASEEHYSLLFEARVKRVPGWVSWSKPPPGVVKFNTDAASCAHNGLTADGVIRHSR
ncbi:conserved hypothetical protein [Ricinus communis]|uniref:Uncharacterized protein n=1 Tax=Ricinus communis TaxID=3988 RepID=B9T477_RICCO|nr:conserved hypothetical protein [Ricinus communis]